MAEEERTKKQEFLRESIMNAGYDTDAFLTLMNEKKGNHHLIYRKSRQH